MRTTVGIRRPAVSAMTRRIPCPALIALVAFAAPIAAQPPEWQVNQPGAIMDVNGVQGTATTLATARPRAGEGGAEPEPWRAAMETVARQSRRAYRGLVYEDEDIDNIKLRLKENLHYLRTVYPGKKDIKIIQTLKGMQREYEEELIWGYVGIGPSDVFHGRLGFYTGDIFTKAPTQDRDVTPVLQMLEDLRPNVVSLAFDPDGTGPDTHYKVLQVLHEALLQYRDRTGIDPEVWGYRNVWHKYHPADANVYIPVSLNTIAVMAHSFMNCFGSQKNASFPSFEYDGPFCYQTQKVWVDQFRYLRTLLGHEWFEQNESPRLRAARAFVYLRKMPLSEFSGAARALAEITEAAM